MSWFQIPQDKFRGLDTSELFWLHKRDLYDTRQVIFNVMADQCLYHSIKLSIHPAALLCDIANISQLSFGSSLPQGIDISLCIYMRECMCLCMQAGSVSLSLFLHLLTGSLLKPASQFFTTHPSQSLSYRFQQDYFCGTNSFHSGPSCSCSILIPRKAPSNKVSLIQ